MAPPPQTQPTYQKQVGGVSAVARQQGREREGSSGGGEGGGGGAAVVGEGVRVVAVQQRREPPHGGGLTGQRLPRQRAGVHVRGKLLDREVGVRDERTPHAVVARQNVGAWGGERRGGGEVFITEAEEDESERRRGAHLEPGRRRMEGRSLPADTNRDPEGQD